jgi:hypothetical protein
MRGLFHHKVTARLSSTLRLDSTEPEGSSPKSKTQSFGNFFVPSCLRGETSRSCGLVRVRPGRWVNYLVGQLPSETKCPDPPDRFCLVRVPSRAESRPTLSPSPDPPDEGCEMKRHG